MSRINDLLRQLDASNPALAKDLRQEVDALADRRAFGLNFERHVPEAVELPGRKVRRGDKVHILPERGSNPTKENERLWTVVGIDRTGGAPVATLEPVTPSTENPAPAQDPVVEVRGAPAPSLDTSTVPTDDLVVVAEFRDPIYPGLVSTGKVERGGDKPFHTVINAENYHALQTLLFTHRGQVDCIYIDPPYNTGNDGWIYNDQYVADDDLYKHSKWLAFIERRLLLAKELLMPTGVIIVAIGDDEHHRLRMLMDQVFDARNFIMNISWQGGVSALAKHHGGGVDYMLVYGRDAGRVRQFRDPKPFAPDMIALVRSALDAGKTPDQAQSELKEFIKSKRSEIAPGLAIFNKVDQNGDIFLEGDLGNSLPRPNLRYTIVNPETGRSYPPPANGWEIGEEKMLGLINQGRIIFGNRNVPARKKLLVEQMDQLPSPSFYRDRRSASQRLRRTLGGDRFPNSKDPDVLMRWLRMACPSDGLALDFFGGSGSTVEAIVRLNEEDKGSRRCILVTNNEVSSADAKTLRRGHRPGDPEWEAKGVFEYVAKPRIETVVSGTRPDGSTYSDGLKQNVEFFTLTYEAPLRVSSNREFAKIAPLLWMRAGSQGRRIDALEVGWDVADTYGVVADLDQSEDFLKAVAEAGEAVQMAFIVTDEDRLFTTLCRELPDHVEPVRLYEAYLRNFEIETGRGAL